MVDLAALEKSLPSSKDLRQTLAQLEHSLAGAIQPYRTLLTSFSTFVDNVSKKIVDLKRAFSDLRGMFKAFTKEHSNLANYSVFQDSKHYYSLLDLDETKIVEMLCKDINRAKKQVNRLENQKQLQLDGLVTLIEKADLVEREQAEQNKQARLIEEARMMEAMIKQQQESVLDVLPIVPKKVTLPEISMLSKAEQQELKDRMLGSIVRSKRMQGDKLYAETEVLAFPEMDTLESKSLQELRDLRLKEVWWRRMAIYSIDTFGLELSDGQSCNVGQLVAKESYLFKES